MKETLPSEALLLHVAMDLTASLSSEDRHGRLVRSVASALPADAACLLRLEDDALVPVAAEGLSSDALGRRFLLADHPRLERICAGEEPVIFPADSPLPDPFDGLLAGDEHATGRVHACAGCPLRIGDELIGALTLDALEPRAFDGLDPAFLATLGALAGAALRTSDLIDTLEEAAQRQGQVARDLVRDYLQRQGGYLIGNSDPVQQLRREVSLAAQADFPILVTGETGSGKELVVRTLHAESARADRPLVYVNCAALPESVVESELFGHEAGSFTGAQSQRAGKFQVADGASLFLDEIGELPLSIQPKLLRVLQSGEVQRVGSDEPLHVDVRIITATNRDLEAEAREGRFRADLLHRLNVYRLHVPALREHADDVPLIAGSYCDQLRRRLGLGPVRVSPEAQEALRRYPWPGNVRELENVLSRATLRASSRAGQGEIVVLQAEDLGRDFLALAASPAAAGAGGAAADGLDGGARGDGGGSAAATASEAARAAARGVPLRHAVDDFQRDMVRAALERNGGVWAAAARDLGMHRSNLHHLARRLGLRDQD